MGKDTYLVIGGSGVLGRAIVEALLARGDDVSVFDVVQKHHDTPFYSGDITDKEAVKEALKKSSTTCIIHTASPRPDLGDKEIYHRVNVEGTRNIIAAAVECGVPKLVYTSSAGVVFQGRDVVDADESLPYPEVPIDAYNGSKAEGEQVVLEANGKGGLLTVALRPASIFGPGDQSLMSAYQGVYDSQRTHMQLGDNSNLFDWTPQANVVHAHLLAADRLGNTSPADPPVAGEAFFISNGSPGYFWDFPRAIWKRLASADRNPPPVRGVITIPKFLAHYIGWASEWWGWLRGTKPALTRYSVMYTTVKRTHSIDKARRALGYEPQVTVEEGIDRMVNWWLSERAKGAK